MPKPKRSNVFRRKRTVVQDDATAVQAIPAAVPANDQAPLAQPDPPIPASASQSKVRLENFEIPIEGGNRLVDVSNLLDFIQASPCSECLAQEGFEVAEVKMGVASTFTFRCKACRFHRELKSSKEHTYAGDKYAENNTRVAAATLAIGKNYTTICKFLAYLNLPPLMAYRFWQKNMAMLDEVYQQAAEDSMLQAADEERQLAMVPAAVATEGEMPVVEDVVQDITCSCDGTWQKRGFSSNNGVCTVLTATGKKVLDVEVMSRYCNSCAAQRKRLNAADFAIWHQNHVERNQCDCNHTGSAGAMEPAGMLRIFQRSIPKRRLRYVKYLGDGDSKTFKTLLEAEPPLYPGTALTKLECTGHVQKRAKTKLASVISNCSSKEYVNDKGKKVKGIGGRNGITEWHIRRIQGHYGAAIRNNAGNLEAMTAAVWSIYYHRRGDHSKCGIDCPAPTDLPKANVHRLPDYVMNELQPAFHQLADESLLTRCLHGGTQNNNESFHHLIWERCPKTVFATLRRLRLAVNGAILSFNDGEMKALNVFKRLGFHTIGSAAYLWARRCDHARIKQSVQQTSAATKSGRKRKTFHNISEAAKKKKAEGEVYAAGAFLE
jgi:hypothetical protein